MGFVRLATWSSLLFLMIAGVLAAQESTMERAKREAAQLRQASQAPEDNIWKDIKTIRDRSAGLHNAIRDWIEVVLPRSRATLQVEFSLLAAKTNGEFRRAGLFGPDNSSDTFGSVNRIEFSRPPEDADKVVAIVGVDVPCGSADAVYIYDYSHGAPRRVLESRGERDHDESIADVRFSKRTATGNQLILTLRYAVQCGSSWNRLFYDLFRLSSKVSRAIPILAGEQGVWFGAENPYQIRLAPDELLMEISDRGIGGNNRPHVHHFNAKGSLAERVDPVALQPQDFVDEWLIRPWSEMDSRSADKGRDKLKEWHQLLAGDFVSGEFQFVQQCREASQWQVALDLDWVRGKALPEKLRIYFLVQQSDRYRFQMVDVNFNRQEGCPGESLPDPKSPTLFPTHPQPIRTP